MSTAALAALAQGLSQINGGTGRSPLWKVSRKSKVSCAPSSVMVRVCFLPALYLGFVWPRKKNTFIR